MNFKHEVLNVPAALPQFLEKDRGALEKLVRETRWGEGPLFVLSDAHLLPAGLAAAYTFESLGGWPVVARSALDFRAYALPACAKLRMLESTAAKHNSCAPMRNPHLDFTIVIGFVSKGHQIACSRAPT